jgi:hypothetical protein
MTDDATKTKQARDAAREQAAHAAEAARDAAAERARGVRDEVEARADQGRARTAGAARRLADALEDAAHDMEDRGPESTALGRAARGARSVADLIDDNSMGDIAASATRFARRNPAAFLAASALAGFALSRVATAMTHEEDDLIEDEFVEDDFSYPEPTRPPEPLTQTAPAAPAVAPERTP